MSTIQPWMLDNLFQETPLNGETFLTTDPVYMWIKLFLAKLFLMSTMLCVYSNFFRTNVLSWNFISFFYEYIDTGNLQTPIKYRSEWTILNISSVWKCFFANYGVEWPDPFQDSSQFWLWPTVNLRNSLSRYGSKLCACTNGSSLNETIPLTIACGSSAHHVIDCHGSAWEAFEPCAKLKNKEGLFVYASGRDVFSNKRIFFHAWRQYVDKWLRLTDVMHSIQELKTSKCKRTLHVWKQWSVVT